MIIAEAAIVRTNVTRVLQQRLENDAVARGKLADIAPLTARESAKREQYEVSVVDEFIQAGGASFAYHGSIPIWERQVKHRIAGSGRHPSIDVSLFNADKKEESRIEFGFYARSKLAADSSKLHKLRNVGAPDKTIVSNYVILWNLVSGPLTGATTAAWLKTCEDDAAAVSGKDFAVKVAVVSAQDLFVTDPGSKNSRMLQLALFEIKTVDQ